MIGIDIGGCVGGILSLLVGIASTTLDEMLLYIRRGTWEVRRFRPDGLGGNVHVEDRIHSL